MISAANVDNYNNLSKREISDMVRFMGRSEKSTANLQQSEEPYPSLKHKGAKPEKKKRRVHIGKKLERQLSEVLSKQTSSIVLPGKENCCCPRRRRKQRTMTEDIAISQWTRRHCRTTEEFFNLMDITIKNARASVQGLKNIKEYLEYSDDPSAEAQGLSQIGGSLWLITFAVQHLIDPEKTYKNLTHELIRIRALFQEIGNYSQQFVQMTESFFLKVDQLRENCIGIVKVVMALYKIEENPFDLRPEIYHRKQKIKRRVGRAGYGSQDLDEETDFQVHWTPLNIVYRKTGGADRWESFATLSIEDKIAIFKTFFTCELAFVETAIEEFSGATHATTNLVTAVKGRAITSTLAEVTQAMLNFINSREIPSTPIPPSDLERWTRLIDDFWVIIDILFEVTYDVTLLVQESRDIVRTCYVYAGNFYHWKLADFEDFDPATKTKAYKANMKKTHEFVAKLMGHRRYSDTALFLSLADFSSSIYQEVVKKHEVFAGDISMKLDAWNDEPTETWGLVGDRDEVKAGSPTKQIKLPSIEPGNPVTKI